MKIRLLMVFAVVFAIAMWWLDAHASPATCSVSGQVFDSAGNPVANAFVYFNSRNTQVVNGNTIAPIIKSATTDINGNLSTIALVQGVFIQITICQAQGGGCSAPITGFVPLTTSVTFQNLLSGTAVVTGTVLTGNLNASGFRIFNLGANTTNNDALSQGVSSLNNLAAPTGNYAMGSFKLTGLAAGTGSGDSMTFGLNHLNDLATATGNYSMGTHRLTSVATPTTAGDALGEGNTIGAITPGIGNFSTLTATGFSANNVATGTFQCTQQTFNEASGGTITPVIVNGCDVALTITDNGAWTLANPTFPIGAILQPYHWWIRIANASGGAGGTITMGSGYRVDSSWSTTGPANGKTRVCGVLSIGGPVNYVGPCTADETS